MAVISLIITQSEEETVPGIPNYITISANIPSIIFFTLDGTDPNSNSSVYINPIQLPTYQSELTLKVFATNGNDNSGIITQIFVGDISGIENITYGAKFPQAITNLSNNATSNNSLYPFGSNFHNDNVFYTGIGNSDNTIFDQNLPSEPNAYDGDGNPAAFSNSPLDPFGTKSLNKNTEIIGKQLPTEYTPEFSSSTDKLFDPKALVIYHDGDNIDPLTPQMINRPLFSLENPEVYKGMDILSPGALESSTATGSFIGSHYNPTDGTMNYYYRDSTTNRWIISKFQYTPTAPKRDAFSSLVFGRENGSQYVYPWVLWRRNVLPS